MTHQNHEPHETPELFDPQPVGQLPPLDIDTWRQALALNRENARQVAEVPFIPLESKPEMLEEFHDVVSFTHRFQHSNGVEPTEVPAHSVHTFSTDGMVRVFKLLHHTGIDEAIYDSLTGVVYLPELASGDLTHRLEYAHMLAHELGHKLLPGIGYNTAINSDLIEGSAEYFSRDYIHNFWREKHKPGETERLQRGFRPGGPLNGRVIDHKSGLHLDWDEIMDQRSEPPHDFRLFSYIRPVRMMKEFEKQLGPENWNMYWQQAMSPEGDAIDFLNQTLGEHMVREIRMTSIFDQE